MRLKKLMSLVLACAMALSLATVASAADTRIYFAEDFSSYVDTDEMTAIQSFMSKASNEANNNNLVPNPTFTPGTGATNVFGINTSNSGPAAGHKAFVTNSFGSKAFQTWGDSILGTADVSYLAINRSFNYDFYADTPWNPNEKQDETLVISYEYEPNLYVGVAKLDAYAGTSVAYFTDSVTSAGTKFSVARERHGAGTAASGVEGEEGYVPATAPATYIVDFPDGQGGANQIGLRTFDNGSTVRIAYGFSYDSATNLNRYYALNGERIATSNVARGPFSAGKTIFYAFRHGQFGSARSSIANIKIYTMKTNDFKVTVDQVKDVALTTKSMRVYFSNIVAPATYAAPVVKADGVALEEGTYSVSALKNVVGNVGGEVYSYVDVTFDALEEGTVYTVEFPETITNEIGTALAGKNVATFATKYPDVKLNSLTVVGAANLVANGTLQKAKVALENTTSANKAVALIYAVYTTNGQLADVVYVNDEIVAEETAEIEVELKYAAAGTAKAFVWNNMEALKPYTGSASLVIAE